MNDNTAIDIRDSEPGLTRDLAATSDFEQGQAPLFPGNESESFRAQWRAIQESFVDEPRRSVEQADQLVSAVIARLSDVFAQERERMQHDRPGGNGDSTEGMRQALRQYRAFLDRLLAV